MNLSIRRRKHAQQEVDRGCGLCRGTGRVDARAGRGARVLRRAAGRRDGIEPGARQVRSRRHGPEAGRRHDARHRPPSPADRRQAGAERRRDSRHRPFAALRQGPDRNRRQAAVRPAHADAATRRRCAPLVRAGDELDDHDQREVNASHKRAPGC